MKVVGRPLNQVQRLEKYLLKHGSISTQHGFASQVLYIADVPKTASILNKQLNNKDSYLIVEQKYYNDQYGMAHKYCVYSLTAEYRKENIDKYA